MILFLTLAAIIVAIISVIAIVLGAGGLTIVLIFGDLIFFVIIVRWIINLIRFHKRNKKK